MPTGVIDGAAYNKKYAKTIKNYGVADLANSKIIEKLEEWDKTMYAETAIYPLTKCQIQILWIMNTLADNGFDLFISNTMREY